MFDRIIRLAHLLVLIGFLAVASWMSWHHTKGQRAGRYVFVSESGSTVLDTATGTYYYADPSGVKGGLKIDQRG
jgi:hypothetical protein